MKRLLIIASLLVSFHARSQIDLDTFLEGGKQDANTLLKSYTEPVFTGLGVGLNSGWYNTAKPHNTLGFDLTIITNVAFVPADAETFTFNNADYTSVRLSDPDRDSNEFPTLLGKNLPAKEIPELTFIDRSDTDEDGDITDELIRSTGLTGAGLREVVPANAVPFPVVQLGIGVVKNTELKLRLVPGLTFGDPGKQFKVSMFGLGVMHDIKQWIPGMKALPFQLSAFVGFNRLNLSFQFDEDAPDKEATLNINGFTFQGIISKKFAFVTTYAGVGFLTSSTDFALRGTYSTEKEELTDPVDLNYRFASPRFNIGARFKLAIVTLHAEYTLQRYNTLTVGFGFSVR